MKWTDYQTLKRLFEQLEYEMFEDAVWNNENAHGDQEILTAAAASTEGTNAMGEFRTKWLTGYAEEFFIEDKPEEATEPTDEIDDIPF